MILGKIFLSVITYFKKKIHASYRISKDFLLIDLRKLSRAFEDHDGELSTCALAFFLLISFIPTSLVIISILSYFYNSEHMALLYLNKIKDQLPSINIDDFVRIIDRIVYAKRYLAFIWIPFLFWWGSLVFDIIERALGKAFRIEKSRKYWKAKIRHFLIILGMGMIAVAFTFLSNFIAIIKNSDIVNYLNSNIENISLLRYTLLKISQIPFLLSSSTTLIINSFLLYVIYRFVPPKNLNNRSLFKGALFASFSYEVVKLVFSYYITQINDYTSIFGPLSTIVVLMIWIWYTCFLFVIGAEMAWIFYEKSERAGKFDFDE